VSHDDSIAALLPFYDNGTLDGDQRRIVESHLPSCPECRALLDRARLLGGLRQADPARLDDHPHAQHLDRFATAASALDADHAARIREHVAGCTACREAVDLLRGAQLLGAAAAAEPSSRWWRPAASVLLSPRLAAVYLVLLLLIVPAYRVLVHLPDVERRERAGDARPERAGAVDLPVLSNAMRGAAAEVVLSLKDGQPWVVLGLAFDYPEGLDASVRLDVSIADETGRIVFSEALPVEQAERALAETGFVALLVAAERLGPAWHRLTVDLPDGAPVLDTTFLVRRVPPPA
jgi:hypothetical protein